MPLDPEMARQLRLEAEAGLDDLSDLSPVAARERTSLAQAEFDSAVAGRNQRLRVEDREVALSGRRIPVRVYAPSPLEEGVRLPTLAYFHGGGWVVGSIAGSDATCRELAEQTGGAVVSVGYRLSPEHKFPAAVDDAIEVVDWLSEERNAAPLGLDPGRLLVGGDSAGGNLAAVVALHARDARAPPLLGQVLLFPVTDTDDRRASYAENAHGYGFEIEFVPYMWHQYLRSDVDRGDPRVAVVRVPELSGLPPALVLTAEFDMLRDEGEEYAHRMRAAGVDVTLHRYDGVVHNFIEYRSAPDGGRSATEQGRAAIAEIAGWLRERSGGAKPRPGR